MDVFPHSLPIGPALDYIFRESAGDPPCPACGNTTHITHTSLICHNPDCEWVAGNAYDVLSKMYGADGMDIFNSLYSDLNFDEINLEKYTALRACIGKLRKCFKASMERSTIGKKALMIGRARMRKLYGRDAAPGQVSFLSTRDELKKILTFCRKFRTIPNPPLVHPVYLITPVFGDYHTPAGFIYEYPGSSGSYQAIVDSYKAGIIGLWNLSPGQETSLTEDRFSLYGKTPDLIDTTILGGFEVGDCGLVVDYRNTPDTARLESISALTHIMRWEHPPSQFIEGMLRAIKNGDGALNLVRRVKPKNSWLRPIIAHLMREGDRDEAMSLQNSFDNPTRYTSRTGNVFLASSDGFYMAPKSDPDAKIRVTNFVLEITEFIHCPDSGKSFSSALVRHGGSQFSVTLDEKHLEKPREIEKTIQAHFDARAGVDNPTVLEPTLMKQMLPWFNKQRGEAPYCRGVDVLGWAPDNSGFTAPGWVMNYSGERQAMKLKPHPDSHMLSVYNFWDLPAEEGKVPKVYAGLINMAAALMARAYTGRYVRAIPVLRTNGSSDLLKRLFSGLGQREAVQVSFKDRKNHYECFRGMPFYGNGTTATSARDTKNCAFVLTDEGMSLDCGKSFNEKAPAVLHKVVQDMAAWLLNTQGAHVTRIKSATYENELEREGELYIRDYLKFRTWPESARRYEKLEQFLSLLSPSSVREWFTHDLATQKVSIRKGDIDISDDLKSLCDAFSNDKGAYSVDALSASWMLEHYFEQPPEMAMATA
jgi:hypothetical protein